jgi:hypothetical protein
MTGDNNGNVYSQALDAPGLPATLTQAYNYDGVNRAANGTEVFVDTPQSTANDFDATTNRLETAWAGY